MAQAKRGSSPHTKRRHALQRIVELEARQAQLERSRPRTPGKKGAKTRALNTVARQLRAARGALTKARNAIAKAASGQGTAKRATTTKRSEAAKKGWATRRARASAAAVPAPIAPFEPRGRAEFMPFLTGSGVVYVNPVGSDRSFVGKHWNAIRRFLENHGTEALDRFDGQSIFDTESGRRLPFVTDPNVILEHEAELDLGPGFYKRREEVARFAA
jgi:hypothetical protein